MSLADAVKRSEGMLQSLHDNLNDVIQKQAQTSAAQRFAQALQNEQAAGTHTYETGRTSNVLPATQGQAPNIPNPPATARSSNISPMATAGPATYGMGELSFPEMRTAPASHADAYRAAISSPEVMGDRYMQGAAMNQLNLERALSGIGDEEQNRAYRAMTIQNLKSEIDKRNRPSMLYTGQSPIVDDQGNVVGFQDNVSSGTGTALPPRTHFYPRPSQPTVNSMRLKSAQVYKDEHPEDTRDANTIALDKTLQDDLTKIEARGKQARTTKETPNAPASGKSPTDVLNTAANILIDKWGIKPEQLDDPKANLREIASRSKIVKDRVMKRREAYKALLKDADSYRKAKAATEGAPKTKITGVIIPQDSASQNPKYVEGQVYEDAQGNRAKYQGGRWIEVSKENK